jgi:Ca-activated chloride channel homolog
MKLGAAKHIAIFFVATFFANILFAQYYVRGQVRDEKGNPVADAKIKLLSKPKSIVYTDNYGGYNFENSKITDSAIIFFEGYTVIRTLLEVGEYQTHTLKILPAIASLMKNKLNSKIKNLEVDNNALFNNFGESYTSLLENDYVEAQKYPESSFALSIDRASYSNIRRFINNGLEVPVDAVRIEEMLNYFDFKDSASSQNNIFTCKTDLTSCPWNKETQLLHININVPKINLDTVPASNLVFLIDISGSMDQPNKLPLLKSAFKLLVDNLRAKDIVSIVTYGGGVNEELPPTSGANKALLKSIIDSLDAGGDTPGEGAIKTAYAVAKKAFIKGGNNRVILATDGDFNVGQTSDKDLEDIITIQRQGGINLTCLGVGMGNYKNSKLEGMAKKGNGNFAYIDNYQEAEKVLVKEFTKTIYTVAKDAAVTVNFNSNFVKKYRLVGFDNKKEALADTSNSIAGGEVGSGHNAIAIFEILPQKNVSFDNNNKLGQVVVTYKKPNIDSVFRFSAAVPTSVKINIDSANANLRLAASICMFGGKLKKSNYIKGFDFEDIIALAQRPNQNDTVIRKEFFKIVDKADKIYNKYKKKKSKKEDKKKKK